jgi:hypothetical protein
MKAWLDAQLNPTKTLAQLIADGNVRRLLAVASLIIASCG